jgi:hypothetical protein
LSFTGDQACNPINNGVKVESREKMKAFGGQLSGDETKVLVAYVRTLKKS